mmetsp:Transcript_52249/g.102297  ORF Transcript_52249/g.102297 Transcript_52249/m.102297 type:complete len:238 (-) Transcript_52249:61-774(-)
MCYPRTKHRLANSLSLRVSNSSPSCVSPWPLAPCESSCEGAAACSSCTEAKNCFSLSFPSDPSCCPRVILRRLGTDPGFRVEKNVETPSTLILFFSRFNCSRFPHLCAESASATFFSSTSSMAHSESARTLKWDNLGPRDAPRDASAASPNRPPRNKSTPTQAGSPSSLSAMSVKKLSKLMGGRSSLSRITLKPRPDRNGGNLPPALTAAPKAAKAVSSSEKVYVAPQQGPEKVKIS